MRVETSLPLGNWRGVADAARRAEAAGFDGLRTYEIANDPFAPLALAATVTERVRLGTAIAVCFPRSYHGVLEAHGAEDLGHKLHAMSKAGRWSEMAAEVPDDLLREFAAAAPYEGLAAAVRERFGGLTDAITVDFPPSTPAGQVAELVADLEAIPAAFRSFPRG
ncbi:MAG: LLM class flavin-dependent oxidoreductase [Deltaproteobacteria bacterium]|nr:LLM class flavin-dependent oxidoreductase [Deltaproteobacteria bacterium]